MIAIKARFYFFNPFTWVIWLGFGLLWLITRLPYAAQKLIGLAIGRLIYLFSPKLKHITLTNLRLCFPELAESAVLTLCKRNFGSLGLGIIETAMAWWMSARRLQKCQVTVTGMEYAEQAFARGKGIILLSPHSTCLEMIGRLIGSRYTLATMYRPHKNPMVAKIQERYRQKYNIKQLS